MHAISQLLLRNDTLDENGETIKPTRSWHFWHPFVNVSITANECSVVCPRKEADELFTPLLACLDPALRSLVSISIEDYSVILISGEGLEAGQRVLDLTSPLAMAGISIFFITSYWSDFILVPLNARAKVIHALEDRGFIFEAGSEGEAGHMTNPASPSLHGRHRNNSSTSSFEFPTVAGTPPPANVFELQEKTFRTLRKRGVSPTVDRTVELVTCAGVKDTAANLVTEKLQLGLLRCLTSHPLPKFLSLTLTDSESASLTLEKRLLPMFYNGGEDLLLGKDGPEQVAITLDLSTLPHESTGIVCGVAGKLIEGMKGRMGRELFNMSYLSTAKAGHVIVYEDELDDAIGALHDIRTNGVGVY